MGTKMAVVAHFCHFDSPFRALFSSAELGTGCSLDIVFSSKILKYSGLLPFSVFPRRHCVYTHQAGRTPALQQNWQSSDNSQNFKEKHNNK